MAFTHDHVNAFAIVSGDSDFIPLVNKLKEYGKTVFVVGGKAFTSTILQQNCHEFISYESLLRRYETRSRATSSGSSAIADRGIATIGGDKEGPPRRSRTASTAGASRYRAGAAAGRARFAGPGAPRRAAAAWAC